LRKFVAVTWNHSLRPDSEPKNLYGFVWMEQHPDCQPCGTETMNSSNDNNADCDQQFERKRIYDDTSLTVNEYEEGC